MTGRGLHPGDREFGNWLAENVLSQVAIAVLPDNQAAAVWAAANLDDFATARAAGRAQTVRGIYAKWQEIDAERKAAEDRARAAMERIKADAERKIAADAKAQADAEKAKAKAKADEEAAAIKAAKQAKDEATRAIAKEQARVASAAGDDGPGAMLPAFSLFGDKFSDMAQNSKKPACAGIL